MADSYKLLLQGNQSSNSPDDIKEHKYDPLHEGEIRLLKLEAVRNTNDATDADSLVAEIIISTLQDDQQASADSSQHGGDEDVEASPKDQHSNGAQQQSEPIDDPEYDALSYVWGGAEPRPVNGRISRTLFLKNPPERWEQLGQYSFLRISENLEAALRSFRKEVFPRGDKELYLWIDAVCINQKDSNERSVQIRRMADIYKEAAQVRVWLGEETDESRTAFKFIKHILSMESFDNLVQDKVTVLEWDAFRSLLQTSWFKRRWIVQEIAFAKKAAVFCGTSQIPWQHLAASISLFADARYELRNLFKGSKTMANNPDYLGEINSYSAKTLVDSISLMFRRSGDDRIMTKLLSLESLLTTLTPFDAQDPHDSIYAIVHLAADAEPESVKSVSDSPIESAKIPATARPDMLGGHYRGRSFEHTISGRERMMSPDSISDRTTAWGSLRVTAAGLPQLEDEGGRGRSMQSSHLTSMTAPSRSRSRARAPSPGAARRRAELRNKSAGATKIKRFKVDYNQSVFKLYREAIGVIIEHSKSLDIICKPWVPIINQASERDFYRIHKEDMITLPSWIQSLKKRVYELDPVSNNKKYIRVAADSLVGTATFGKKPYSACADFPVRDGYGTFDPGNDRVLKTRGFILDIVEDIADKALNAIIPNDWLSMAGWNDLAEDPPDQFWKTVVANRQSTLGPEQPPHHWPNACKWAFRRKPELGDLNPEHLINNVSGVPSNRTLHFLERMRAVVWNRRLFKTRGSVNDQDEGDFWGPLLGLGPPDIRAGDLICILYGCSVPVILRQTCRKDRKPNRQMKRMRKPKRRPTTRVAFEDTTTPLPGQPTHPTITVNEEPANSPNRQPKTKAAGLSNATAKTYTLVGECYVHAFMDGEAFTRNEKEERNKDFILGCCESCNCGCSEPV